MLTKLVSDSGHIHFPGPCNGCIFSSTDGWHCTASEEEQENLHIIVNTKNNTTRCSGYISGPEKKRKGELKL